MATVIDVRSSIRGVPLPTPSAAVLAVGPPVDEPGYWAGGPSAQVAADGSIVLAYRLRRPVGKGRGYAVAIARSLDGVHFDEIGRISSDEFDSDSLERPTLVRLPGGGWRLYLSLATPDTLHWSIWAIDADDPASFDAAYIRPVLDGGPTVAYKDPVIHASPDGWQMWVCRHDVGDPALADAMTTEFARSDDGVHWTVDGVVLSPSEDGWDRRGARVSAVVDLGEGPVAFFDGRSDYAENWEERTGVALVGADGRLDRADPQLELGSGVGTNALRYLDAVVNDDGIRYYYEASSTDGSHALLTEYAPRPR